MAETGSNPTATSANDFNELRNWPSGSYWGLGITWVSRGEDLGDCPPASRDQLTSVLPSAFTTTPIQTLRPLRRELIGRRGAEPIEIFQVGATIYFFSARGIPAL